MHPEDFDMEPEVGEPRIPAEAIGQGADLESSAQRPTPYLDKPARNLDKSRRNGVAPAAPASESAEQHVLAACFLDDGPTLDRARATLTPDSFHFPEHAVIFRQLCALRDDALPLTPAALAEHRAAHLAGLNPMLLVQLTDPAIYPTTAHAGRMIARVADLARRRTLISHAVAITEAIALGVPTDDLPAQPVPVSASVGIPAHLDSRRVRFTTPPAEPVTRLFLAGKPVATPGNLVTVIAKSKTGKTASLGAAVAAILGAHYDRHDLDTFKFTAPHTSEAVVLIDTEQSPYDAWTCHSRMMARAGQPTEPEWLHHYAMVGDSSQDLRNSLPVALDRGRTLHKGVFCVILDGVADFVASVNNEAECNDFIAFLRKLAVEYNCPIICVIHSNEGVKTGDDGRGHLGKQLTRKAESNLLLKKVGEVTTITSEKQRKAPITEADQVAFQWSEEHQRHMSCAKSPATPTQGRKITYDFSTFSTIFPNNTHPGMTRNVLHRYAADCSNISESAFRDLLSRAVQDGQLERITNGQGFLYRLPKV